MSEPKKTPKEDPYPFDRIFKTYLNEDGVGIIQQMIGNKFTQLVSKPTEFSTTTQKLDFLYEAKNGKKLALLHLEVQTGADNIMLGRMLSYLGSLALHKDYIKKEPLVKHYKLLTNLIFIIQAFFIHNDFMKCNILFFGDIYFSFYYFKYV